MSSLTLDDLINEKKKNNGVATEEEKETTKVEQPKEEPKKEEEKQKEKRTAPNFDKMELKEVKVSDFAKPDDNGKSLEQENMDRLLHELDEGIEAAKKRRFQPAIDEINKAREEYMLRKEAGEKNPQVKVKSTVDLELDPNYTDAEVETIKEEDEFAEANPNSLENTNGNIEKAIDSEIMDEPAPAPHKVEINREDLAKPAEAKEEKVSEEPKVTEPATDMDALAEELDDDENEEITELESDLDLEEDKEEALKKKRQEEDEKILAEFKKELGGKLIKPKKNIDFSRFKIVKHNTALNKVLAFDSKDTFQSWGLFTTGVSIAMSPLSAIELDEINPNIGTRNGIAKAKAMFNTIYKHLAPQCRMDNMENWMKHISYLDLDNLYFAIYVACFGKSNIVPHVCTNEKCRNMFSTEPAIMDMVKFGKPEEDKKVFDAIYNKDYSAPVEIEETLIPVNDRFAFGITPPSLYNSSFESAFLDQDFIEKYAGIIAIASCVNSVYSIDMENETLTPIQFKSDANDIVKTYKYKILNLYRILNRLEASEFKSLEKELTDINTKIQDRIHISYQIPETICPKCGHKIEAQPMSAADLVFMRHQLIRILD